MTKKEEVWIIDQAESEEGAHIARGWPTGKRPPVDPDVEAEIEELWKTIQDKGDLKDDT